MSNNSNMECENINTSSSGNSNITGQKRKGEFKIDFSNQEESKEVNMIYLDSCLIKKEHPEKKVKVEESSPINISHSSPGVEERYKDVFELFDIKNQDEKEIFLKYADYETYANQIESLISDPRLFKFVRGSEKVTIYGLLKCITFSNLTEHQLNVIKRVISLYRAIYVSFDHGIIDAISYIIEKKLILYIINIVASNLDHFIINIILEQLFKTKLIEEKIDVLSPYLVNHTNKCSLLAIKYNSSLVDNYTLKKDNITYNYIIKYSKNEKLIQMFKDDFTSRPKRLLETKLLDLFYDAFISGKNDIIEFILSINQNIRNKSWIANHFYAAVNKLKLSETDAGFPNIETFKFFFNKVKLEAKEYNLSNEASEVNTIYNTLQDFQICFMSKGLDISKPFIDQYKLEKLQPFNPFVGGTILPLNKESFVYYLTVFPQTGVPGGYLTTDDILYLINNGFPKEKLENINLKSINALEFINVYDNIKSQSISTIKNFIPSVLTDMITEYIS